MATFGEFREPDTRRRILDAAVAIIDASGDASLRVLDIADVAGVAPGLINHHFGSRDGLIAAAQSERYSASVAGDFKQLRDVLGAGWSHEKTVDVMRGALAGVIRRDRAENRLRRTTALAAAHGRPDLRVALSEAVANTVDGATQVVEIGQAKGIFDSDLDPRAAGTVMLSMALGYVIADFDARPASEEDLVDVISKMLVGVFRPAD